MPPAGCAAAMASAGKPPCIFCEIVAGRAPAHRLYEDEKAVAFLDLFPITRGHMLVVPKRHVDRLTDLPESDYADVLRALTAACRRAERLSRHYNVGLNQGALAGQIVFHLHFHVIPRYDENNPFGGRARTRLADAEARDVLSVLSPS
jgi:histidine triad (HIT) family protein